MIVSAAAHAMFHLSATFGTASRMEPLEQALALMRCALDILDACGDPHRVTPHLDLAIARLAGAIDKHGANTPDGPTQTQQ